MTVELEKLIKNKQYSFEIMEKVEKDTEFY